VKQIRIVLAGMPMMLLDIISEIVSSEPDLTVVEKIGEGSDVGAAARRVRADVVVVQQSSDEPQTAEAALLSEQQFRVIALADDGHRGFLYELRPHRVPLGEISAGGLVAAIRAAAQGESS
jgi:DNA-binding NarL/FixJ family response regulator